jgi:hypothetical protein
LNDELLIFTLGDMRKYLAAREYDAVRESAAALSSVEINIAPLQLAALALWLELMATDSPFIDKLATDMLTNAEQQGQVSHAVGRWLREVTDGRIND